MVVTEECPNCGAPYSATVAVEMGDRYADVFGSTPRDLLSTYLRICPDPETATAAGRSAGEVAVYLHRADDLRAGGSR